MCTVSTFDILFTTFDVLYMCADHCLCEYKSKLNLIILLKIPGIFLYHIKATISLQKNHMDLFYDRLTFFGVELTLNYKGTDISQVVLKYLHLCFEDQHFNENFNENSMRVSKL